MGAACVVLALACKEIYKTVMKVKKLLRHSLKLQTLTMAQKI
jgi:hypothetical protein